MTLDDLCKYNILTNEWTWMKGSVFNYALANYGSKGIANINNDPGSRLSYTKWKDMRDNFWLMGGVSQSYATNDVWKYDLGTNQWIWMYGPNVLNDSGNYQSNCIFETIDMPYSRLEQRSAVTDNCGRFWLFGGITDSQTSSALNDLWVFDPQQLEWNLINGSNVQNQPGNYGRLGVASPSNIPPSRCGAIGWWGNDNKFYMFGGLNYSLSVCSDLWVFNPDTNCLSFCNSVVALPPVANFQSNKTTVCQQGCISLSNQSINATSYQWSFQGGSPSSSSNQNPQVCYLDSGIYNVTLIAFNSAGSDTLSINNYITVNPAPPVPVIKQIDDTVLNFVTDINYSSYQWYLDSNLIPNATDTFLLISKNGNYNVEIIGKNGCKISAGINVIIGLQNYMSDHVISLWPNPVQNQFTIHDSRLTIGIIEIYNVLGQVCQQSKILNLKSQIEVDVSDIPSGIYFVQLIGEKERWVGRFVKE